MKTAPTTDTRVALAPELTAVVNGAVAEMDELIQRGRLQNDPLRFPIVAEQVFLRAFYEVALDLVLKVTTQQAAPVAVPDREWRRVAIEIANASATEMARIGRRAGRRNALFAGAGLVVALGVGAAGGWWWRGFFPMVAGVSASAQNCEHKPDGSVLCWIPFWQVAPPAAVTKPESAASK